MRITVVEWKTDFCLYENFLGDKAAESKYVAGVLGVNIDALKSEEEKARTMANHVLENAKDFVWRLSEYEMKMVRVLVDAGHGKAVRFQQSDCMIPMCLISVANVLTSAEEERTTVWMPDELLDAITPYVMEFEGNERYEQMKEYERYIVGLTCLYGPLLKGELKKLLEDFYEDEEVCDAIEVMETSLISTICVTAVKIKGKRDTMYYPPYINLVQNDVMHYYHSRLERGVKLGFKEYDFEQILAAGDIGDIKIPNPHREKLIKALVKYAGKSRPKAVWDMFLVWISAEQEMDPRDITDNVTSWCDSPKTAKALQKVVVQYLNNIPMWALKGYTSLEMLAIDHTKVGVTSCFGDRRYGDELDDLGLFGDVTIEKLDDDFGGFYPYPMGEA